MKKKIPPDIKADLIDMLRQGDYAPIPKSGPRDGNDWLALCEEEAAIQENKAQNALDGEQEKQHRAYARRLRKLAAGIRAEGHDRPTVFE